MLVGVFRSAVRNDSWSPKNLLIATHRVDFIGFLTMAPVTMPVLVVGLTTCIILEIVKKFGYGNVLPERVREILVEFDEHQQNEQLKINAPFQATAPYFSLCPSFPRRRSRQLVLPYYASNAFNGVIEEHDLGHAFEEALPFTALLVVFFGIVGVIHDNHLFSPVITWVLSLPEAQQPGMFYIANGLLSAISDNVFVATVYIGEVHTAYTNGDISRDLFDKLAVAINTGTNIPSVAHKRPSRFLFLLTSSVAL